MEDPPTIEAPTDQRRLKRDWFGIIVSVAALVTSVVSIVLAIQNSGSMDRLVQANSWPYLQINSSNLNDSGEQVVAISLSNVGVGPLKLESFVVSYKGEELSNAALLLRACCLLDGEQFTTREQFIEHVGYVTTGTPTGAVLAPGGETLVLQYDLKSGKSEIWSALNRERFSVDFRACYCSVFDECWETKFDSVRPKSIKACPAEKNSWNG